MAESVSNDPKIYPHETPNICSICGSSANYHFYGAIACDSCRTFFRRYAHKPDFFTCIRGTGTCVVSRQTRKQCSSCRFKKCIGVGMKPQLVRSTSMRMSSSASALQQFRHAAATEVVARPIMPSIDLHIQDLTSNERTKIYEMLSVMNCSLIRTEDCKHLVGDLQTDLNTLTCVFISRVIRALNTLQSRDYLGTHDQKILLQNSVAKILFLQSVPTFDVDERSWYVYKNPLTREGSRTKFPISMYDHLSPEIASAFFNLVLEMDPDARLDYIFMTIVAAICFYDSSCPGLTNSHMVEFERDTFYRILRKLILSKMRRNDSVTTIASEMNRRVFTRLDCIQNLFENSILHIDPGEQIRLISRELEISPTETLYQLPSTSLVPSSSSSLESSTPQSRSPETMTALCSFLFYN